ncbi:MAG: Hpt domain-containing protein, partial [Oscillospiraceae bacterium]|nr:Hpt domain-containing protein [Oscillospiraceae bacterium]
MRELDPMLDVFIFETQQLLEALEETLLQSEKIKNLTAEHIDEIFRVMHTIKGSSAMMSFDNLVTLSHALEDMFDNIRAGKTRMDEDMVVGVTELVLVSCDMFKLEVDKLLSGAESDGDFTDLAKKIQNYTQTIMLGSTPAPAAASDVADSVASTPTFDADVSDDAEQSDLPIYKIKVIFDSGCQME